MYPNQTGRKAAGKQVTLQAEELKPKMISYYLATIKPHYWRAWKQRNDRWTARSSCCSRTSHWATDKKQMMEEHKRTRRWCSLSWLTISQWRGFIPLGLAFASSLRTAALPIQLAPFHGWAWARSLYLHCVWVLFCWWFFVANVAPTRRKHRSDFWDPGKQMIDNRIED